MNNQKGFINVLVIITVLVVVSIAGYYFIVSKKATQPPITTTETPQDLSQPTTPTPTPTPAPTPTPTPTGPKQTTETPKQTTAITFALKSDYLRNETTAQGIASGKTNNYDIRTFPLVYGGKGPYNTDNFAYRFLSSLRMLGYTRGLRTVNEQYIAEQYLNRFQQFNNLAVSPFINASILKIVDSALADKENLDKNTALNFPLYNHLATAPLNEPTKEHVAALLSSVFSELSNNLVIWSEKNFKDFYIRQFGQRIQNADSPDYQICESAIYPEFGVNCAIGVYFGTTLINKVPANSPQNDDFSFASLTLHEYAHYLDQKLYSPGSGTSRGVIDTIGFYNISYDTSDPAPGGVREFAYRRPQNVKNEFVSSYAQGWKRTVNGKDYYSAAEDFAESFSLYVTDGKVFRKLAESSDVLKQKYDWLKTNVFNGREYQSGDIQSVTILKQQPNLVGDELAKQATGAFNVVDYSTSLPNFVWNYKFLNGSLVSKP